MRPLTSIFQTSAAALLLPFFLLLLPTGSRAIAPESVDCSATWEQQQHSPGGDPNRVFSCPSNCTLAVTPSDFVYGDVVYHLNSSLCLAAIHAGAFRDADGGDFALTILQGADSFTGVKRNGIVSLDETGNKGTIMGAFLARPYAVETDSVMVNAETNEITVKSWKAVPGDA